MFVYCENRWFKVIMNLGKFLGDFDVIFVIVVNRIKYILEKIVLVLDVRCIICF